MNTQMLSQVVWPMDALVPLTEQGSLPQDRLPPHLLCWARHALLQQPVVLLLGPTDTNLATRHALRKQGFRACSSADCSSFVLKVKIRPRSFFPKMFREDLFHWGGKHEWRAWDRDRPTLRVDGAKRVEETKMVWKLETGSGQLIWEESCCEKMAGMPYAQAEKLARKLRFWVNG